MPSYVLDLDSPQEMSYLVFGVVFSMMVAAGATAAMVVFEIEFSEGVALAGLYLIATMILAALSGLSLATG